jgi:hypothetical protein
MCKWFESVFACFRCAWYHHLIQLTLGWLYKVSRFDGAALCLVVHGVKCLLFCMVPAFGQLIV